MTWLSDALGKVFGVLPTSWGWNNVLDLLLVAVFIYYVLVLIRGTRAVAIRRWAG